MQHDFGTASGCRYLQSPACDDDGFRRLQHDTSLGLDGLGFGFMAQAGSQPHARVSHASVHVRSRFPSSCRLVCHVVLRSIELCVSMDLRCERRDSNRCVGLRMDRYRPCPSGLEGSTVRRGGKEQIGRASRVPIGPSRSHRPRPVDLRRKNPVSLASLDGRLAPSSGTGGIERGSLQYCRSRRLWLARPSPTERTVQKISGAQDEIFSPLRNLQGSRNASKIKCYPGVPIFHSPKRMGARGSPSRI